MSGSAGLNIERAPGLPEPLLEAGLLIVRSRVTRRRCRHHLGVSGRSAPLPFVLAGSSRCVGGVNMQRPQRRVSAARTNDVDIDERRERIIDEGAGGWLVENGQ